MNLTNGANDRHKQTWGLEAMANQTDDMTWKAVIQGSVALSTNRRPWRHKLEQHYPKKGRQSIKLKWSIILNVANIWLETWLGKINGILDTYYKMGGVLKTIQVWGGLGRKNQGSTEARVKLTARSLSTVEISLGWGRLFSDASEHGEREHREPWRQKVWPKRARDEVFEGTPAWRKIMPAKEGTFGWRVVQVRCASESVFKK